MVPKVSGRSGARAGTDRYVPHPRAGGPPPWCRYVAGGGDAEHLLRQHPVAFRRRHCRSTAIQFLGNDSAELDALHFARTRMKRRRRIPEST